MAKSKTTDGYIRELKKLIKSRTGADCEPWLIPQIRSTAMNMTILDKIQDKISDGNLTSLEVGSSGQSKTVINPLLITYKDLQRTLLLQFEAVGLNYKTTPSKVKEDTRKGVDESDPMAEYYRGKAR